MSTGPTAPPARPAWLPQRLYPFQSRFAEAAEARVHYVDEGEGPPLLLLHGNPTWSFLYRDVIAGLRDRYRCIAPDYPGFGLSGPAPLGYRYTPADHAAVIEQLVLQLDLRDITMMVHDWGGPIGFAVATRHPDRFAAFVIANTWAWPKADPGTRLFSYALGGPIGRRLILHRNVFVERVLPGAMRLRELPLEVMDAYRGPFPTPASRRPTAVFPHEIIASRLFLADVDHALPALADRPALLVWPTKDVAFRAAERERWEALFPNHRTVLVEGAGHYVQEEAPDEVVAAIREWREVSGLV